MTAATFRLPGPLAIAVATVDQMSDGRIELGLGTGWYEQEHTAYGIPFPDVRERFDRLEEQLEIIIGLWRTAVGDTFSFGGTYYQLKDSPALPKPHQSKPPIVIGGLAARFADEFNVAFCRPLQTGEAFDRVRAACASQGRDTDPVYSAAQVVCCGRDDAEVARRASAIRREVSELRDNGLAGSPAEIVDKIGQFGELGCGGIYLQVLDLDDLAHLELLASEVLPRI
jgi:alkanesulfonate monooxygenase SsuD/methylene tetrahydromethanopterin reductase-like flavin-dependent oxidoreductase (luciferase family)